MGRIVRTPSVEYGSSEPRPGRGLIWVGAALSLAGFVLVAVVGSWPWVVALNVATLRAFQALFPIGSVDSIALLLVFGSSQVTLVLLAAAGGWLFLRGRRLVALTFLLLVIGVAIEVALKATLAHPMIWPEFAHGAGMYPLPEVKPTGVIRLQGPFPSGHVLRASYLALAMLAVLGHGASWRWRSALTAAAGVFIAGIVFGVLYLGWHWPTDALGSLALAYALAAPTWWVANMDATPNIRPSRRRTRRGDGAKTL